MKRKKMRRQKYVGELKDFIGTIISQSLEEDNQDILTRIDNKTFHYREFLNNMPTYQRKILVSLALHNKPARINELTSIARIPQQNNVSSQVFRLVKKGLLEKKSRGSYFISKNDPDLLIYIQLRCGGQRYLREIKKQICNVN